MRHAAVRCQAAQLSHARATRPPSLLRSYARALTPSFVSSVSTTTPRFAWVQPQHHTVACRSLATSRPASAIARSDIIRDNPKNNVTDTIFSKLGTNLHQRPEHPLGIIKEAIFEYFEQSDPGKFKLFEDLYPVVTTAQNFDELLIPSDHVSRSDNDTYYVDENTVLRCHTSAHQAELLREKHENFLVIGDVYRRDTIDATHYPVFHQMEGVKIFDEGEQDVEAVREDLKRTLEGLAKHLFGDVECRWVDAYFPFTDPSIELEIFFNGPG